MCRRVLLVVLWLLIGTRSPLPVVGLLIIAEPLCPSRCFFGTILVTLCLMVWDFRVSRAELMLSCFHDLLFLFFLLLFYLFPTSMGVLSLSPGLAQRTPINNNNDNARASCIYPQRSCIRAMHMHMHSSVMIRHTPSSHENPAQAPIGYKNPAHSFSGHENPLHAFS